MPAPDQLLGGYKLIDRIGAGGMGEVWKAEDTRLGRIVAVKILPPAVASDSEAIARMRREARTAAQLNHPNIATIHAFDEADGQTFIVMEFVAGEPLSALIKSGALSEAAVCRIGRAAAEALAEAHGKGIIHRDIKPDNILVSGQRVKVLDFGIAKRVGVEKTTHDAPTAFVTQQGMILGTVHYMSPEQALGKTLDARTDVFSLGVVLYEAATGKLPFGGETITETITQIVRDEQQEAIRLNPSITRGLNAIIQRCLRKNRDERFATAAELAAALGAQLARVSTETRTNPNIAAIGPNTAKQPTVIGGSKLHAVEDDVATKVRPVRKPAAATAVTAGPAAARKRSPAALIGVVALLIIAAVIAAIAWNRRKADQRTEVPATTVASQQQTAAAPAAVPATSTVSVTATPVVEEKSPAATDAASSQSAPPPAAAAASPKPTADQFYAEGMRLLIGGDTAAAREKFVEAIKQDPRHAKAHFRAGEIALFNHNFPHAADEFRRAIESSERLEVRERALAQLGLAIADGDRERANFIAREIHRANPNDPDLSRLRQLIGNNFGRDGVNEGPRPLKRRPWRP